MSCKIAMLIDDDAIQKCMNNNSDTNQLCSNSMLSENCRNDNEH